MCDYEFNVLDKEWIDNEIYQSQQRMFNTIDNMLDSLIKTFKEIRINK